MIRFRTGFAPGTVDRLGELIGQAAVERSRETAKRAELLLRQDIERSVIFEPTYAPKVGRVEPTRRRFNELITSGYEETSDGGRAFIGIVADATDEEVKKVLAIEFGAGPHEITPRRKNWLTGWEWDDRQVFTKKVMHPGSKGRSYLRRARDRVYQRIRRGTV